MYATLRSTRRPRALSSTTITICARLRPSAVYVVLVFFQKLPNTARTVAARVGRRFAAFAHVPYEDARARRELVHLMDDLDIGHDSQSLATGNKAQQFRWWRFANVPRESSR
jgi:uncharacterized iron-regulated protein